MTCLDDVTVSADAATAPLSANSEAAAVSILDSATTGDGANQWYVFTDAWIEMCILQIFRFTQYLGCLKLLRASEST